LSWLASRRTAVRGSGIEEMCGIVVHIHAQSFASFPAVEARSTNASTLTLRAAHASR
jgi:hypothetical protein